MEKTMKNFSISGFDFPVFGDFCFLIVFNRTKKEN